MLGLVVLGSSGSGKTSFCHAMKNFVNSTEECPIFINLDPGNYITLDDCHINIQELINSYEIMPELNLGPNGSFMYSVEYFEKNSDWFECKFSNLLQKLNNGFLIFDFPGQIELFTHNISVRRFIQKSLSNKINLVGVTLTDSFFFKDTSSNNSLMLVSIIIMLNVELPHLNLLSKTDLIYNQNWFGFSDNFYFNKYKYPIKTIKQNCFIWSKRLLYDFTQLMSEFSTLNLTLVSVYFPKTIKIIYNKLKCIIKS